MSTSDPKSGGPEDAGGLDAASAFGLPSPELMASWANAFFRASGGPPELVNSVPDERVPGLAAGQLASPTGNLAPSSPPGNALPAGGLPPGSAPFGVPLTSGLAPAAPIGGVPGITGVPTSAPYGIPGLQNLPFSGDLLSNPPRTLDLSTPAQEPLAGAATAPATGFDAAQDQGTSGLYFLEYARDPSSSPELTLPSARGLEAPPASGATTERAPGRPAGNTVEPLPASPLGGRQFDPYSVRRDFPILREQVNGKPLIWLDNAATTQKPQSVIDRLAYFYEHENSNIHRAAHTLAARSTDAYEAAREKVRKFVNAPSVQDIVFTRGTTEAINLVAQSWGRRYLRPGDEIVITWLEHHSNIVPWQLLCSETGAKLRVAPIDDSGQVLLEEYEKLLGPRTRLVSFTQVSNALGSVTPAQQMVAMAHRYGARVLVDGAQAVSHMRVDVQSLDCDFYVFSGHKVFGPTGIGALYGKSEVLESMPPWQGGGNMIADVTFEKTVYHPAPSRFEAGTGNIADAVGLGAALDYVERIGIENIGRYEHELLVYGSQRLLEVPRLRLIGTAKEKAGVMSFVIDGIKSEQVGAALAQEGIAVRAGHHCAQPALRRFGLETTVRPSLALYNTCEDIDALVSTLKKLQSSWLY